MSNSIPNFNVGLQVTDGGGTSGDGEKRYSSWANNPGSIRSEWAFDSDQYDPDAVKAILNVEQANTLTNLDFRIGVQAIDFAGTGQEGTQQYTPWASQGGGWSGFATDSDLYDPDGYRIWIETQPWATTASIKDLRLGIQLYDFAGSEAGNTINFTPWASQGGGESNWTTDRDQFDPDGLKIKLEVSFGANSYTSNEQINPFASETPTFGVSASNLFAASSLEVQSAF